MGIAESPWSSLLEWSRENGLKLHGIEPGFVSEGWRGVLATRHIAAGTCILRVPRRLLMSVESARRDAKLCAALQKHGAGLSSDQVLAVHLLCEAEKGPASFWQSYLRSLPPSYTTAMCLTADEAAALQAPHAVQAAAAAAAKAAEEHSGALLLLRALGMPAKWRSRGAWLWAASTLSSRTMYLPFDSAGALCPIGDLHNYRPPPPPCTPTLTQLLANATVLAAGVEAHAAGEAATVETAGHSATAAVGAAAAVAAGAGEGHAEVGCAAAGVAAENSEEGVSGDGHLDEATNEYCIVAGTDYAAGDQVFLCYGRHTSLELLQHYGFVMAANPHDTAPLALDLLPAAVVQQLATSGSCGGGRDSRGGSAGGELERAADAAAFLHASGAPSWQLLRALRLACATSAERKTSAFLALSDKPISAASERAAFVVLKQACTVALAALPTSIEEDERQLASLQAAAAGIATAGQQQPDEEEQQHLERMLVVGEWRLLHKRVLHRGILIAEAVLAALPGLPGAGPPAMTAQLAPLLRTPRW